MSFWLIRVVNRLGCESANTDNILTYKNIFVLALSKTAATGDANVADIPAAAPATRRVCRSLLVWQKNCAISKPKASPVIIMGPSAPRDIRRIGERKFTGVAF